MFGMPWDRFRDGMALLSQLSLVAAGFLFVAFQFRYRTVVHVKEKSDSQRPKEYRDRFRTLILQYTGFCAVSVGLYVLSSVYELRPSGALSLAAASTLVTMLLLLFLLLYRTAGFIVDSTRITNKKEVETTVRAG